MYTHIARERERDTYICLHARSLHRDRTPLEARRGDII